MASMRLIVDLFFLLVGITFYPSNGTHRCWSAQANLFCCSCSQNTWPRAQTNNIPDFCINKVPALHSLWRQPQLPPRPAPLSCSPGTACSGMPLMGKNLAAGTQYVTCVSEKEREPERGVAGMCFYKAMTGWLSCLCVCVCLRVKDCQIKGLKGSD